VHSQRLWDELCNFVKDLTPTGIITYHAASGFDDLVMAFLIAVQTSEDENLDRFYKNSVTETKKETVNTMDPSTYDSEGLNPVKEVGLMVDTSGWN
jgi:hypothetical protein